jgi:hypothetical protein
MKTSPTILTLALLTLVLLSNPVFAKVSESMSEEQFVAPCLNLIAYSNHIVGLLDWTSYISTLPNLILIGDQGPS